MRDNLSQYGQGLRTGHEACQPDEVPMSADPTGLEQANASATSAGEQGELVTCSECGRVLTSNGSETDECCAGLCHGCTGCNNFSVLRVRYELVTEDGKASDPVPLLRSRVLGRPSAT